MKSSFMYHEGGSRASHPKLLLQNALGFPYKEALLELKGYFRFPLDIQPVTHTSGTLKATALDQKSPEFCPDCAIPIKSYPTVTNDFLKTDEDLHFLHQAEVKSIFVKTVTSELS